MKDKEFLKIVKQETKEIQKAGIFIDLTKRLKFNKFKEFLKI